MFCAKRVFRCFKALERLGNRITGAAGPYFVGLAVILLWMGTICFFDVIAPSLSYPLISIPLCLLVALNMHAHYFYVCTVKPGFIDDTPAEAGTSFLWAKRKDWYNSKSLTGGVRWTTTQVTPATMTRCGRCDKSRPERAHHCKVCNRCVLKYDHHCPVRINQCVGLHNERHFVLFLAYLSVATFCVGALGYNQLIDSFISYDGRWTYHVPEVMYGMIYILSVVLCFAVTVMGLWHLWGISNAETSVESHDHEQYRQRAKARREAFVNSYDLGRKKNLSLFFNIGENGYPLYTLFIPFRILPYTDGRSWARPQGLERHRGVRAGEELTDASDDEDY
ncbi:zf-DHHC-domain-containing protein [Coprinopsis marcescibilis]|uniref:Palmitoyltransferase n=1 Tax=Coprinopsis marcescibilis TaxID=230819 RepID=A0A5C3L5B1_COPMA|nr:zf-DHHC-domain-containing protein [Coprinopsis marcescibilis]